jgi:hypothetical protein
VSEDTNNTNTNTLVAAGHRPMITADDVNPISMMFDPVIAERVMAIAQTLARGVATVPKHLQGNVGDCLAIVMQSASWKLNPFAVAQKTFLIGGRLGYEAQLLNAVATSLRVIDGRFEYTYFGDWSKIAKKPVMKRSQNGYEVMTPGWDENDEGGIGVTVTARLRGDPAPRDLELLLQECWPRNSTLWAAKPRQQIAYLAVKQWMRLYAPDAILGVYTVDELQEQVIEGELVNEAPTNARQSIVAAARAAQPAAPAAAAAETATTPPPVAQAHEQAAPPAAGDDDWPKSFEGTLYDSRGIQWVGSVHSSNKTCNDDGTWRRKKGVMPKTVAEVEQGLRRLNWTAVHAAQTAQNAPAQPVTEGQDQSADGGPANVGGASGTPAFTPDQIHDGISEAKTVDEVNQWLDVLRESMLDRGVADDLDALAGRVMEDLERQASLGLGM